MKYVENSTGTVLNYQKKVLKLLLVLYSLSAAIAGTLFIAMKFLGLYDEIKWKYLIILMGVVILEIITFRIMYKQTTKNKLWEKNLKYLKIIILFISYLNYMYLTLMVPSNELWICVFYFIILSSLFLDLKFVSVSIITSIICQIVLFTANPMLLPAKQVLLRELIIRIVVIFLTSFGIFLFTYFASSILKEVDSNEKTLIEKNNNISRLLNRIAEFAQGLLNSSESLTGIIEEENSAIQEIVVTTETINNDTSDMLNKSIDNKKTLNTLLNINEDISLKINGLEKNSSNLIELSSGNESSLKEVLTIINALNGSIKTTTTATNILEEKSQQMDEILSVIIAISEQTNLLALNASIEAARAGEVGKGFSVVANEVKSLAESSKASSDDISNIIHEFKNQISQLKELMKDNNEKIIFGDSLVNNTVNNVINMIRQLKASGSDIKEINGLMTTLLNETKNVVNSNCHIVDVTENTLDKFKIVTAAVKQNAETSSEIIASSEELKHTAIEMNKLIE